MAALATLALAAGAGGACDGSTGAGPPDGGESRDAAHGDVAIRREDAHHLGHDAPTVRDAGAGADALDSGGGPIEASADAAREDVEVRDAGARDAHRRPDASHRDDARRPVDAADDSPDDAGRDAERPVDAAHDSSRPLDAAHDSSRPLDAAHDSSRRLDAAHDSSRPFDAAHDSSRAFDAAHDSPWFFDAAHDSSRPFDAAHDSPQADDASRDAPGSGDAAPEGGYDAGSPAIAYVGRIDNSSDAGPQFQWSGTQVVIDFRGTGVTLEMADYGDYFDVYVDGALQPTPIIGNNITTVYPLASGLADGPHEVIVDRRTEAYISVTQILGVSFPDGGALLPPAPRPDRRLEVIGDSITCALGVLGVGPDCTPTPANEDHTDSYEAVAARALGADLITVAWSGEGAYEDYGGALSPTMPELYPYALPPDPDGGTLWDFNEWTPDAVVINLGTDDFWNGDPGPGFPAAYLALLEAIRGHYPDAYILCTNGPLLLDPDFTTAEDYIEGAIAQRQAAGDTNIGYLSFGIQGAENGYGCDYHPSVATHAMMGATLEAALQAQLGW